MEMSVFERNGTVWTRFKIKVKELKYYSKLLSKYIDLTSPVKENSRYIYYEKEGDWINGDRSRQSAVAGEA